MRNPSRRHSLVRGLAAQHPWKTRSAGYRQFGPRKRGAPLNRLRSVERWHLPQRPPPAGVRAARWLLVGFIPAAVTVATMRRRLGVPPALTLAVASAVPIATAAVTPPSRWRYIATGSAYMWVFKVTWELPFDDPEKLESRLRVSYPIRVDSLLGAGTPPGLRLQRALRVPGKVSVLDRAAAAAYASWLVPHLLMGWVLLRHPRFVPRAAGRLAAAYHLTTPFYWAVPTAPPWWASEERGAMEGGVERVLRQVKDDLRQRTRGEPEREDEGAESPGNPWGSMPSDHIASAAITAMALSEVSVAYGVLGWTYVVLAAFSVVYLGEHYLVDVIAGLLVAEAIRLTEPVVSPAVRRIARDIERVAATAR